jgi:hypothetical protein
MYISAEKKWEWIELQKNKRKNLEPKEEIQILKDTIVKGIIKTK